MEYSRIVVASVLIFLNINVTTGQLSENYGYIVVGAGSAGATVASRLSEDPEVSVLLLEAGGYPSKISEIPLFAADAPGNGQDWNYRSTEQKQACLGYKDKKCILNRGKVLGGSSVLNYMVYSRGSPMDFDLWAESGATGWSYKEVLPYFKKSEGMTIVDPELIDPKVHGYNGPLTVSGNQYASPLQDAYLSAFKELGYKILDYNSQPGTGFAPTQTTTRNGARCSTEKAFLQPAYGRKNFKVKTNAHVTKIEIVKREDGLQATGVHFEVNGKKSYASANIEIIVSGGSINTPQILMLSGIGPKNHLESFGIEVLADLPVGLNYQDHFGSAGLVFLINTTDSYERFYKMTESEANWQKGKSPWATPASMESVGFIKTHHEKIPGDFPNLELLFLSNKLIYPAFNSEILAYYDRWSAFEGFSICPISLHTKTRGSVKLNSSDPYDKPIMDYQYLSDTTDVEIMLEGVKRSIALTKTKALAKFNASMIPEHLPGCEDYPLESDEYLVCILRSLTLPVWHPLGTSKMGQASDPTTVVDQYLQVKGVAGLSVADASVMPFETSGHTNAPSIMIGEKAADMVKNRRRERLLRIKHSEL